MGQRTHYITTACKIIPIYIDIDDNKPCILYRAINNVIMSKMPN